MSTPPDGPRRDRSPTEPPTEPPTTPGSLPTGVVVHRVLQGFADTVLFYVVVFLIDGSYFELGSAGAVVRVVLIVGAWLALLHVLVPWWTGGRTPGMVLLQLRIVRRDGTRAGVGVLSGRLAALVAEFWLTVLAVLLVVGGEPRPDSVLSPEILAFFVVPFLFILLTPHHTRPADLVARTLVIWAPYAPRDRASGRQR